MQYIVKFGCYYTLHLVAATQNILFYFVQRTNTALLVSDTNCTVHCRQYLNTVQSSGDAVAPFTLNFPKLAPNSIIICDDEDEDPTKVSIQINFKHV